jgi:hypothetical protein
MMDVVVFMDSEWHFQFGIGRLDTAAIRRGLAPKIPISCLSSIANDVKLIL